MSRAMTTADLLIERLIAWGVDTMFGLPGDGDQRHLRGAAHAPGPAAIHPGAPRGVGGIRRLRLCEVHRPRRRLPGDVRPGRHPPAERPLRREARQPAGAGHHRPHLPRSHRRALPAGRRPRQALRRRRGVQRARDGAKPRREHGGRGDEARARPPRRRAPHHSEGHPGLDQPRRRALAGERPAAQRRRRGVRAGGARRAGAAAGGRRHQRGKKVAILVGRGCLGARRAGAGPGRAARRAGREGAARQGACFPTTARTRPAASACSARRRRPTR